jgi:hypothetical protein
MTTLNDEQIRSIITDALGGMDQYTFNEVVYIAHVIEAAVQDAARAEVEILINRANQLVTNRRHALIQVANMVNDAWGLSETDLARIIAEVEKDADHDQT